jgi:pyruvate dehydrogenase E1 component beta subunit
VDLRSLTPLDDETILASVRKTGRAVIVEECWRTCGLGGEIASRIHENCFDTLKAPIRRVSGLDVPMPYSREIEKLCIPQPENIRQAVIDVVFGAF